VGVKFPEVIVQLEPVTVLQKTSGESCTHVQPALDPDPDVTARVAMLLVTLPAELLTTTSNVAPLSAAIVGGVV